MEGDFFHSPMPEKSSGLWKATFYVPHVWKSSVLCKVRFFSFLHDGKVGSMERDIQKNFWDHRWLSAHL